MIPIIKYPRTPHIFGSRLQPGDEDLPAIALDRVGSSDLIIEEKLDGSNSAISFDPHGALILQSRGHVLTGGPRERQFDLLKRWASHRTVTLRKILGGRFIMYGEWLYAKHTIPYVPFFPLGGFTPLQSSTLSKVAAGLRVTPMQTALAWLMRRAPNILLIPGTSSIDHLRENLEAVELHLSDAALAELNAIGAKGAA